MKLMKLKDEAPKHIGKFWSRHQRKFLNYNEWIAEERRMECLERKIK